MRNYIKTRALTWCAYINPPSNFFTELYSIQNTDAEIESDVANQNAIIVNGYAPTQVDFIYPLQTMDVYWLLDKANVMKMLQNTFSSVLFVQSIGSFAFGDPASGFTAVPPDQQMLGCLVNPKTSPRYTGWKDESGVKRAPTPSDKGVKSDFSGVPGLIDFVNALPAYAAILRKEGRVRDAGIVMEVYNNIISGKVTVSDGLAELRQNGL